MTLLTDELIQKMTDIIVHAVNPQQVILFGSYTRDTMRQDSDLDFLIVEDQPFRPEWSRWQQMAHLWRLLAHFPIAKDILIYSRDEVEHWRHTKNHVIARALREGRLLYERT